MARTIAFAGRIATGAAWFAFGAWMSVMSADMLPVSAFFAGAAIASAINAVDKSRA